MYTKDHDRMVEEQCYTVAHMEKVFKKISENFDNYFDQYLKSKKSHIPEEQIDKLRDKFLIDGKGKFLVFDEARAFNELTHEAICDFEKDITGYTDLFDKESLEEYRDDPQQFKAVALKIETSIIRKTIQNRYAKKLDKYRSAFASSNPVVLLDVVTRLAQFSEDYVTNIYNRENFEKIVYYKDFGFSELDTEKYTAYGVIGGGIKSTMLYKNYPEVFPCRSRMGLWALWFLVDKESFGCKMDSEFLMIDTEKNFTQQNYFYPYELYAFYALQIYLLIKNRAAKFGVQLDVSYRFVYVEAFLNFVASQNIEAINCLSSEYEEKAYV